MMTPMTTEEAQAMLSATRIVRACSRKLASETDFAERVAKSGGKFYGGDFNSYEDVGIGGMTFSFDSDEEMWACISAARTLNGVPVAAPKNSFPSVVKSVSSVSKSKQSSKSRGQIWEECPTCGTEPVCAACEYCSNHCRCGGAPSSSVQGEIYGGQN